MITFEKTLEEKVRELEKHVNANGLFADGTKVKLFKSIYASINEAKKEVDAVIEQLEETQKLLK